MPYDRNNRTNRRLAAKLLKELLPLAREEAKTIKDPFRPTTGVGETALRWYRTENCLGVHVYQGDRGGWFADLQFDNLPLGVGDTIGTPVMYPAKDRQEALRQAVHFLASFMDPPQPKVSPDAVDVFFAFDEIELVVPAGLLRSFKDSGLEIPTGAEAFAELASIRAELAGGGPLTREIMASLPEISLHRLQIVCALALLAGIPRYPEFEEAPPAAGMH